MSSFITSKLVKPFSQHPGLKDLDPIAILVTINREFTSKGFTIDAKSPDGVVAFEIAHVITRGDDGQLEGYRKNDLSPVLLYFTRDDYEATLDEDTDYKHLVGAGPLVAIIEPRDVDLIVNNYLSIEDHLIGLYRSKVESLGLTFIPGNFVTRVPGFGNVNDKIVVGYYVTEKDHRIDVLRVHDLAGEQWSIYNHHKIEWKAVEQ